MRLLFRTFVTLVITAVVVIGGLLVLPGDKLAELAADQLEAQTGRKLEVRGEVALSLWPVLGVKAEGVSLSNADWAGDQPMLTAKTLSIGVSAPDLLRGDVRIKSLSAVAPHLNLSTNAAGQGNWVLTPQSTAVSTSGDLAAADSSPASMSIEKLMLTQASVTYAGHGEAPVTLQDMDLVLKWPDPEGIVDLALTLRPAGEVVKVEGEIGSFAAFLGGQVSSVGATVTAPGGIARFDGRAGVSGQAEGRFTAKLDDTEQVLRATGLGQVDLPRGSGQTVVLGTDLTVTPDGRIAMRDLSLDLDGNALQGAIDLQLGAVPYFTAKLEAGDLDLSDLASADAREAVGGSDNTGWSRDPIDASALSLANGTLDLNIGSLNTGSVKLGTSKLSLSLDNARAVFKMHPASVFGGTVQGQLVANNRNGLSVGGNLTYSGIRLEQALGQLGDYDRLNGEALGELQFLGVGNSQDAIMRSLSGKGWLEIGKGFFTGFDLEGLMRSGSGNGGSTVFDGLTASYTLKDGDLNNEDLLTTLKGVRADGKGRIGLGAQDLDYLFTPTLLGANSGKGLSIPVKITGLWADPKIRPDLEAALENEAASQLEEELRQKLSEELNTEITPEQDVEEVIKDELEQRAKDALLNLLQGN